MREYLEIDSHYYYQAIRELLINKLGRYFYNDELKAILEYMATTDKMVHVNLNKLDEKCVLCEFTVELRENSVVFTDYASYDNSLIPGQSKLSDILEKFTGKIPADQLCFFTENPPELLSPNKAMQSQSAPRLFSSTPTHTAIKERKLSDIVLAKETQKCDEQPEINLYDIELLMKKPEDFQSNHDIYTKLLILHAIMNPDALEFLRFNKSIFMVTLRNKARLNEIDTEFLFTAIQLHGKLSKLASEKKLGVVKGFLMLFPEEKQEEIKAMLQKKEFNRNYTFADDNPYRVFKEYIFINSTINPGFFTKAFRSFGRGTTEEIELFFIRLFENNELMRLTHKSLPLANDVMSLISDQFNNHLYKPSKKLLDIFILTIINYIDANHQLPDFLFNSPASQYLMIQIGIENAQHIYNAIKRNMLENSLLQRMTVQFAEVRNFALGKSLLTQECYQNFLEDIEKRHPLDNVLFYMSLMALRKTNIDFIILSRKGFFDCLEHLKNNPIGAILFAEMLERIRCAFDLVNLINSLEITDQRAFVFGSTLSRDSKVRLNNYKKYACLSFSEIRDAWLLTQAEERTNIKENWLKIHHANMQLLVNAFKYDIHKHIREIRTIYLSFKKVTTHRLASMDPDACNPAFYSLEQFPAEMQCMVAKLDDYNREKYNQGQEQLSTLYNRLNMYKTVNFSNEVVLGFMSLLHVVEKMLERFPKHDKEASNVWETARCVSKIIIGEFETRYKHNVRDHVFTTLTIENVLVKPDGEYIYIEAMQRAPDLINRICSSIRKMFPDDRILTRNDILLATKESFNEPQATPDAAAEARANINPITAPVINGDELTDFLLNDEEKSSRKINL